jgi:hypothetical protein
MPRVTVETNEHQPASGRFAARTGSVALDAAGNVPIAGDGGPAISAEVLATQGAVTSGGDLLFADSGGRVRAVTGGLTGPAVPARAR